MNKKKFQDNLLQIQDISGQIIKNQENQDRAHPCGRCIFTALSLAAWQNQQLPVMTTISELKRDFYNFIKKKQNKYRIVRDIVQCHVRGIICVRRGCTAGTLAAGPPSHPPPQDEHQLRETNKVL